MTISNEAVEAAAAAMWEQRPMRRTHDGAPLPFGEAKYYQQIRYRDQASAALEAAAPIIRAEALEAAADDYRHYETPNARIYLRARAVAERGGQ